MVTKFLVGPEWKPAEIFAIQFEELTHYFEAVDDQRTRARRLLDGCVRVPKNDPRLFDSYAAAADSEIARLRTKIEPTLQRIRDLEATK